MEVRSNNFHIVSPKGEFLLRKNIQHKSGEALSSIEEIMKVARASGVPVPEVVRSKEGNIFWSDGEFFWQLYKFIPGNYYRGTEAELREASKGVALLHKTLAKLPATDSTKSPSWVLPTAEEFEPIFEGMAKGKELLDGLVCENEASLLNRISTLSSKAEIIKNAGVQMIHADLHPHNFLFDNEKLTAILDFGDARSGIRAADAASACHRLVRQYIVYRGESFEQTLETGLQIFLTEYQKVFPLSKDELELFSEFMELALLRKVKGNLLKYYQGHTSWPHEVAYKEFEKQLNLLAEVDVMKEPLRKITATI